jgi:hypothetical protein
MVHIIALHLNRIVGSPKEEIGSVSCPDLSNHSPQEEPGLARVIAQALDQSVIGK